MMAFYLFYHYRQFHYSNFQLCQHDHYDTVELLNVKSNCALWVWVLNRGILTIFENIRMDFTTLETKTAAIL